MKLHKDSHLDHGITDAQLGCTTTVDEAKARIDESIAAACSRHARSFK